VLTMPPGITVTTLPSAVSLAAGGAQMKIDYQQPALGTVRTVASLKLDRPGPVCSGAGYAVQQVVLSQMVDALLAQMLYK